MSSIFRRIEKNCSSFRKSDSVPNSNNDLNLTTTQIQTPEKCLSPLNYQWKSTNTVAKVKRGKSVTDIDNTEEKILNIREQYVEFERNPHSSKFTRQYIKMKLAKIFRSNSKINDPSKTKARKPNFTPICNLDNSTKSQTNIVSEVLLSDDASSDALRNLSFTAAMMSKSAQLLHNLSDNHESIDHTTPIPSSTLRFWRKPSEEKLKASQRRTQENIHGSSEILLRINPTFENKKHPSELSLFYDESNCPPDVLRISNNDIRTAVIVPGYDKALNRYQNIVSQSRHVSRRDKTLSLAYETEINSGNNRAEMRTSQSSNNMSTLMRCHSVAQGLNPDMKRSFIIEDSQSPSHRGKFLSKELYYQNSKKTSMLSPPPYDNNILNKRFIKMRTGSSKHTSLIYDTESSCKSRNAENIFNQRPPKPPPRSDSLLRSFELICKNLTTSISEPRGDSFKIFKSQRDYENWLKNLPYNNPTKIAALLKARSRIARRQCVSELIDVNVMNFDSDKRRRHSWPLLTSASISFDDISNRRASSLSRVKKKKDAEEITKSIDSPSLCNYSRLYSLRNAQTSKHDCGQSPPDQLKNQLSAQMSVRSPLSMTARVPRPVKYRYRQMSSFNPRMTESCHESGSYSII